MRQLDLSGLAPGTPPLAPDPNTAIVDGTFAQALNNDFIARQQELLHGDPDGFYRKQSADALAATPAVLNQLDALRDQLLDTTTTARQRQILAQSLDNHLAISRAGVARHASRQTLAWQNATAQTRIATETGGLRLRRPRLDRELCRRGPLGRIASGRNRQSIVQLQRGSSPRLESELGAAHAAVTAQNETDWPTDASQRATN
jgi:hypothetical protein